MGAIREQWITFLDENRYLTKASYLSNAFEALDFAVIIIGKDTSVVYVNDAYSKTLGIPEDQILGRKLKEAKPGAKLLDVVETGQTIKNRFVELRTPDEIKNLIVNIFPIYDSGKIVGAISLSRVVEKKSNKTPGQSTSNVVFFTPRPITEKLNKPAIAFSRENCNLPAPFDRIFGINPQFLRTLKLASKAASSTAPVMILGPSGVGKELLAKAVHESSNRQTGPFVTINSAAIPETLLESELFGYTGGAFTGANSKGKPGKFEQADGGTLFLDEIGEMDIKIQSKLLRAIEYGEIQPVGDTGRHKTVDVRIVAATNRDLFQMVTNGTFREDLYYRLNVIELVLPSLKERPEDLDILISIFLKEVSENAKKSFFFAPSALQKLKEYDWPGNVRQLKNAIIRAALQTDEDIILPEHLPNFIQGPDTQYLDDIIQTLLAKSSMPIECLMEKIEKSAIQTALRDSQCNKSLAMKKLGMYRGTFYSKLKKHHIRA